MDLLKELQLKEGKSIILITHNMGLVAEMADEVCVKMCIRDRIAEIRHTIGFCQSKF